MTDKQKALYWFGEGNDHQPMNIDEQEAFFEKYYSHLFDDYGKEKVDALSKV